MGMTGPGVMEHSLAERLAAGATFGPDRSAWKAVGTRRDKRIEMFCNRRGTVEQRISKGRNAIEWTRPY